jgi:hypothetical protein
MPNNTFAGSLTQPMFVPEPLTDITITNATITNATITNATIDTLEAQDISAGTLTVGGQPYASGASWFQYPTTTGEIDFIDASGSHTLASIAGNLYYDNELLAKANDIQDIADWALYPALANVDMNAKTLYDISAATFLPHATVTADASDSLFVNGVPLATQPFVAASVANWATYPAVTTVDMSGEAITNASSIGIGPVGYNGLLTTDASGSILKFNGVAVSIGPTGTYLPRAGGTMLGQIDMSGNDIIHIGSIQAGGVTETAQFGQTLLPMLSFSAKAMELDFQHTNPLTSLQMNSAGGANLIALDEINVTGDDVNITTTGTTSILNLTAAAAAVIAAIGAVDITAGGTTEINSVGRIDIISAGNIKVNSGNVAGADTEIEDIGFNENLMYKAGANDIQISNVATVTNSNALAVTTTGTANLDISGAGTVTVRSGGGTSILPTGAFTMTTPSTAALTSTGTMTLTTVGASDIDLYPGTSGGVHIFSQNGNPATNPELKVENQNGNNEGAHIDVYKNSASPAANDTLAVYSSHGNNAAAAKIEYANITTKATAVTAGTETGIIQMNAKGIAGPVNALEVRATGVKPIALYDDTNSLGTAGQTLISTGSGIRWASPARSITNFPIASSNGVLSLTQRYTYGSLFYCPYDMMVESISTYFVGNTTPAGTSAIFAIYDISNSPNYNLLATSDPVSIAGKANQIVEAPLSIPYQLQGCKYYYVAFWSNTRTSSVLSAISQTLYSSGGLNPLLAWFNAGPVGAIVPSNPANGTTTAEMIWMGMCGVQTVVGSVLTTPPPPPSLSLVALSAQVATLSTFVDNLNTYCTALSEAIALEPVPPETTAPVYPPA